MFLIKTFKWNYHTFTWIYMKLVYQNTISRLYEKIIGNLSNVHTQDLNDFIYSAQMKGLHQFHIILQSMYMKFSYTRHIPSYTLQQCAISTPQRTGISTLKKYLGKICVRVHRYPDLNDIWSNLHQYFFQFCRKDELFSWLASFFGRLLVLCYSSTELKLSYLKLQFEILVPLFSRI